MASAFAMHSQLNLPHSGVFFVLNPLCLWHTSVLNQLTGKEGLLLLLCHALLRTARGRIRNGNGQVHTHTQIYTYTYIHTYTHTYTHIHTHIHMHTYAHTYANAYTHTNIHTYAHTYIHTYKHTKPESLELP
jgi:adenine-specific DNA glycosylase